MYNGAVKKFANVKGEGVAAESSSSSDDDSSEDESPKFRLKIIKAKRALLCKDKRSKVIKK